MTTLTNNDSTTTNDRNNQHLNRYLSMSTLPSSVTTTINSTTKSSLSPTLAPRRHLQKSGGSGTTPLFVGAENELNRRRKNAAAGSSGAYLDKNKQAMGFYPSKSSSAIAMMGSTINSSSEVDIDKKRYSHPLSLSTVGIKAPANATNCLLSNQLWPPELTAGTTGGPATLTFGIGPRRWSFKYGRKKTGRPPPFPRVARRLALAVGTLPPRPTPNSSSSTAASNLRSKMRHKGGSFEQQQLQTGDGASSDRSSTASSIIRSRSVTPVIDEEARAKVIEMENQLSSLSTLVHSALMNKSVSESVFKDIEMIRREILGGTTARSVSARDNDSVSDADSLSKFSDLSSEKVNYLPEHHREKPLTDGNSTITRNRQNHNHSPPTKETFPSHPDLEKSKRNDGVLPSTGCVSIGNERYDMMRSQLRGMKIKVGDMKAEVRHIRRLTQINAQTQRDVLKDSFHKIHLLLNQNYNAILRRSGKEENGGAARLDDSPAEHLAASGQQTQHRTDLAQIETGLSEFERDVEQLRLAVVNGERKLKLSEVEAFTATLSGLGRNAARLKISFPELHGKLKRVISVEMEKVIREEKFLKEEPERLDGALRRCKKLTKTMVTMKKLAMVQDPSANAAVAKSDKPGEGDSETFNKRMSIENGPPIPPPSPLPDCSSPAIAETAQQQQQQKQGLNNKTDDFMPAEREPRTPPKTILRSNRSAIGAQDGSSLANNQHDVLDSLLKDLQTVANGEGLKGNDSSYQQQQLLASKSSMINGDKLPSFRGTSATLPRSLQSSTIIPRASLHYNNNTDGVDPRPLSAMGERIVPSNSQSHYRAESPNSAASEPTEITPAASSPHQPAPPPRSSSRLQMRAAASAPPAHIRTNAINNSNMDHFHHSGRQESINGIISASSSNESVDSQGSSHYQPHKHFIDNSSAAATAPKKPPPPPPPPRNRQELMQQRKYQHLMQQKHAATNN